MKDFNDFVYVNPHALSKEVCENIIERWENDDRKMPGKTSMGEVNKDLKKSTDLPISNLDEWKDIDDILFKSANDNLQEYVERMIDMSKSYPPLVCFNTSNVTDSGYNVKKYEPGDYFNWHVDSQVGSDGWHRTIAYIWYLNDVVGGGGQTQFAYGRMVQPTVGKLIMFPSTWNFPHRGVPLENGSKYIITTFLSTNEMIQS